MRGKPLALIIFLSSFLWVLPVQGQDVTGSMLGIVNNARAQVGAPPLSYNGQLAATAQQHSNDMAAGDFLSHTGSDGSQFWDRMRNNGYSMTTGAENVLYRWDASIDGAFSQWYNSDGHRTNMLNGAYLEMGVAYSVSADGKHYFTMVLGTRPGMTAPAVQEPPTNTPIPPPTNTPIPPPTNTPIPPPTNTPIPPPTNTPIPPPTNTPLPPPTVTNTTAPLVAAPQQQQQVVVPSNTPTDVPVQVIPSNTPTTAFVQVVAPSATPTLQPGQVIQPSATATIAQQQQVVVLPTATTALQQQQNIQPTAAPVVRATQVPIVPPTKPPTNNANLQQPTTVAMLPPVVDPALRMAKRTAILPGNGNVPLNVIVQAPPVAQPTVIPPTAAPVLAPPDLRFIWDVNSFSVVNVSGGNVDLTGLSFSSTSGSLDVVRWQTQYLTASLYAFPDSDCLQVWGMGGSSLPQKPVECNYRHSWITVGAANQFWIGAQQFTVNRGGEVLGMCNVAQGRCEVSLSGTVTGQAPIGGGNAPQQTVTTTTTVENANVRLIYDELSLSIWNMSNTPVNLADLTFDSLNGNLSIYKWDNGYLTASLSGFPAQDCLQVWHVNTQNQPKPSQCQTRHSWVAVDNSALAWVDVSQFTVRQRGEVIGVCDASGICDIQVR